MTRIPYHDLQRVHQGPLAVVRACRLCGAVTHTRRKVAGRGRGAGMREGNKGNGLSLQHWKDHHAAELAALLEEHNR